MFAVRENIIRHYKNCKGEPAFTIQFNRKIGTLVKTVSAKGSVDYWRMIDELNTIAKVAKEREFTGREYLLVITEYVEKVTHGIHKNMVLDESSLRLVYKNVK